MSLAMSAPFTPGDRVIDPILGHGTVRECYQTNFSLGQWGCSVAWDCLRGATAYADARFLRPAPRLSPFTVITNPLRAPFPGAQMPGGLTAPRPPGSPFPAA